MQILTRWLVIKNFKWELCSTMSFWNFTAELNSWGHEGSVHKNCVKSKGEFKYVSLVMLYIAFDVRTVIRRALYPPKK